MSNEVEDPEGPLDKLIEGIIDYTKDTVALAISDFLEWFTGIGGEVKFPPGENIETITMKFIQAASEGFDDDEEPEQKNPFE